jgi:vitamin-K-epoxide reductase (warfarin-sensitive)
VQPAVSQLAARNRLWCLVIAILSFAGIVLSAVSLQRHYAKSATGFCDFSQNFNCDIVNRSEYSELQGIPVAAIGVLGYATLFFLSTFRNSRAQTPNRLLAASIAGLGFALYLTYVEACELKTWCILCVASQVVIFLITVFAAIVKLRSAGA